jgi:hypothetical protein
MTTATTIVVGFGAIGIYKNQDVLIRGVTKDGKKLQLLDLNTGENIVGCPSIAKVTLGNVLPTGIWNNIEYCYSESTDTLYTPNGVVFKDRLNVQREQIINELLTSSETLVEVSIPDSIPTGVIEDVSVSEESIEDKTMPIYEAISITEPSVSKYFTRYHVDTLSAMAKSTRTGAVSVRFDGKIKSSGNGKYWTFSVPANFLVGMYSAQKFMIAKDEFDLSLVEFCNANIHIGGIHFESMKSSELFALKVAYAMSSNGIGFAKIHEGLKKGYKIFISSYELVSKKTNKTYRKLSSSDIGSTGPMGEGSTGKFTNPVVPIDSEFGQNVMDASGRLGRLVFEAPNKVVAREMKLGVGKTDGLTDLGVRSCILIDEALNPKGLSDLVKRMLVLGTSWVSGEEYESYGSVRLIPLKSVTAPLPASVGRLSKGQILVGGNTHKSKLNGVLRHALGLSHVEISCLTEERARDLLKPFITYIKLGGRSFAAYKFDVNVKATNFYSLYSLEGADTFFDEESEKDDIKSFFMDALAKVEQASLDGYLFNLKAHIESSVNEGEIVLSKRVTEVTSAEVQQVGVSYGYDAGKEFVDQLMTGGNVASKYYLFEDVNNLPKISRDKIFDLFRDTIKEEIEPTLVPESFVLGFYNLVENDSKGFVISCKGYDFPFAPVGDVEFVNGSVKDVPASLVALMSFGVSLRNPSTDWAVKYANHMSELNGQLLKRVQSMKVSGSYLAAVSGFWLKPTEVFSFGDNSGKVTSAKLPILFDQSITGLINQDGSDTPYSVEELIRFESHFSRIAFVSPEYFLSQENDGDGDLVKIMKPFKSIPIWSGQPSFVKEKVKAYTQGEYDGLKLSLKPYKLMAFEVFHAGNIAAKSAKDNVAIMAANEYRVKQCMMPWLTSGTSEEKSMAWMIAEASAYLVQYEAMRAAKHDGAVSMYSLVKCAPSGGDVKDQIEYIDNWSKLLKDYFGYTCDVYAYVLLYKLTRDLYFGKYNGLVPSSDLAAFVSGGSLRASTFSFAIQQKGYARAISAYAGMFTPPRGKHADDIRLLNMAGINMFRKGGMYSSVYNGVAGKVALSLHYDVIAKQGDVFAYFLKALHGAYSSNGLPTGPKATKDFKESVLVSEVAEVLSATVSDVSDVPDVTVDTVMSDDLISINDTSIEGLKEDEMISNKVGVDSELVWANVCPSIITIVNDGSDACKRRLIKLKRSIMAASIDSGSFTEAVLYAQSYIDDYNDWAEEYLSNKADDEAKTEAIDLSHVEVSDSSFGVSANTSFAAGKTVAQEVSSCVSEASICVSEVCNSVSEVSICGETDSVSQAAKTTKTVSRTVSKPSASGGKPKRFEAVNNGSKRLEGRSFAGVGIDDISSADFRAMKYETKRASAEYSINGDKLSRSSRVTDSYSEYAAYVANAEKSSR